MAKPERGQFYLFDRFVIGYCGIMIVLLLAIGRPFTEYVDEIISYLLLGGAAYLIATLVDEQRSRGWTFVRLMYPVIMFGLFYRLTGGTMLLVFDRFFDAQLTAFEKSIFGVNLSLYIDRHLLNVVVNEIISFCYFCYYLMIPGFTLYAFLKRDDAILKRMLAATTLTFFVGYFLFFLYPIEGPRWFFAGEYMNSIDGPFFREAVNYVIATGAVRGGCMPSTHTAVALIVLFYTFQLSRRAGWLLSPIVFGLAVGTVWGRFHYISDTIVGALIAVGALWLLESVLRERPGFPVVEHSSVKESTSHAS